MSVFFGPRNATSALNLHRAKGIDVRWNSGAKREAERLIEGQQRAREALAGKPRILLDLPTDRRPMPHQVEAIAAAQALDNRVLLADDMGLGKTATALWITAHADETQAVVVCPASVKYNWAKEAALTVGFRAFVIHGTPKQRAAQFVDLRTAAMNGERLLAIINYDLLHHLSDQQFEDLQRIARGAAIFDESHYLKDKASIRSRKAFDLVYPDQRRAITTYAKQAPGIVEGILSDWEGRPLGEVTRSRVTLLLSGTPVRNTIVDLFAQAELICKGTWTGIGQFEKNHCVYTPMQVGQGFRKKTVRQFRMSKDEAGLREIVNTFQIRRRKEEVISLPPKIRTFPELTLDDATRKIYRAMKDWGIKQMGDLDPTDSIFTPQASNAMEVFLRLEQIAQGFLGGVPDAVMERCATILRMRGQAIPGRPNEVFFPSSAKAMWIRETIKTLVDTGHRPTVFFRFNAPLFWLKENLPYHCVALHGGVEDREGVIDGFRQGEGQVFLCQVKMAEGFNLTQSQDAIFYGRDWSPAVNAQAEDRLHRIGQKGTVNVQVPIVVDSLERVIHVKLQAKAESAQNVLASFTVADLQRLLGR